jgi:hypothetical protein
MSSALVKKSPSITTSKGISKAIIQKASSRLNILKRLSQRNANESGEIKSTSTSIKTDIQEPAAFEEQEQEMNLHEARKEAKQMRFTHPKKYRVVERNISEEGTIIISRTSI